MSRAVLACGVVRVCKSVRGKCRSALAYARLGSLDSRAPLARRLCNLTRHATSAVLLSPRTRMLAHPSGSASPNLPSASLRRISRQSEDCHRDARPTQSSASRTAGSAYGGGISRPAHSVSAELREALWRRTRPLAGTSLRSCAQSLRSLRGFPPKAPLSSAHCRLPRAHPP